MKHSSMPRHRTVIVAAVALLVGAVLSSAPAPVRAAADTIPQRLSDQEFWKLSEEFSEPDGYFRSDNLLSNEIYYPSVIQDLVQRTKPGGVYLGVGPEQNFNYITAIKPKIVFITDIRRGNLHTQLMYKALFELSKDRADFFSRLFTKKRPADLTDRSTAGEIINAFWNVQTSSEAVYKENVQAIRDVLTKKHSFPIKESDLQMIADNVYWYFYWYGPSINYNSSSNQGAGRGNMVDYGSLMMAQDSAGAFRSYLASEESFRFMKDLSERNLIVPVVGNFGGPKALRAVGKYVRDHGATVTAFYLSNVEQYLQQDGIWNNFCANVASMPLDASSTFIRSRSGGGGGGSGLVNYLGSMLDETRGCAPPSQPQPAGVKTPR
jgi:hypothetical protein